LSPAGAHTLLTATPVQHSSPLAADEPIGTQHLPPAKNDELPGQQNEALVYALPAGVLVVRVCVCSF
jgi:hypothetical protein